jgi:hypothetical protein
MILVHKFVKSVPDTLESGVIYVSVEYATVIHKCCCGCGNEVVTPLSPTDWKLTFDGKSISLYPSIGNWSFKCQSHYWIKNNKVEWSPKWDKIEIVANRKDDTKTKKINSKPKGRESFFGRLFKKKPTK